MPIVISGATITSGPQQNVSGTSDNVGFFPYGWPAYSIIQPGWTCVQTGAVVTVVDAVNLNITTVGTPFTSGSTYTFTGLTGVRISGGVTIRTPPLPPPTPGSASLNGTSQYLSASNAAFTFAGDFTVEGWYCPTSVSGLRTLFTIGAPTAATGAMVVYSNSGTLNAQPYGGSNTTFSGATMSVNTWHHIALVRSGSTIRLYFNGTAHPTTITNSSSIGNGAVTIGFLSGGYGYFAGQISNFRVAASAVYTGNFTTPTAPLTDTQSAGTNISAITAGQTQLLLNTTNDANFLVDSSSYTRTVTNNNSIASSSLNPFFQGSAYFKPSSYLGSGSALTLGTTCTFECWFRTTSNPATSKFVLLGGSGNRGLNIYNGAYGQSSYSATVISLDWETADNRLFTVPTMAANTWYHLAATFNAGTATLWLNGTRSSTGTIATGWNFQSQTYRIGAWVSQSTYSQNVYISNPRLTNSAVYDVTQTTITVPTAPLTAIANTQLLLNTTNNANFLKDSSTNNITITNTGGVVSSSLNPF
jgi:hypothetical protein